MSGNKDEDSSPNMGSTNASPANSEKMVMSPLPTSTATVERRGELRREQGLGLDPQAVLSASDASLGE